MVKSAVAAAAEGARSLAAARPDARGGDHRGAPRPDARSRIVTWVGPHARRERGHHPRHGPPARRLDHAAGRARREARRRDHRRPSAAQHRHGGRSRTIRCAPRPRRRSPPSPGTCSTIPRRGRRSRAGRTRSSPTRRSATGSAGCGRIAAPACSRRARDPGSGAGRPLRRGAAGSSARRCSRTRRLKRAINQFARRAVGRRRRELWRRHRHPGLGDDPRLGRAHGHRPAGKRGRPRPSIYPDQRHPGRRPRRAARSTPRRCWT